MQICGLDVYAAKDGHETRQLVASHLEALRQHSCFRHSRIVLIPEANLSEGQEVAEHVISMPGLTVLSKREDTYGVYTVPGIKAMFVFRVTDLLAHQAISYHSTLVTANPFLMNMPAADKAANARKEFERQLRSFRRVHLLPRSVNGRRSEAFSGKVDKDNKQTNRLKDDMCMAFLFGVYWSGQHLNGLIGERGYTGRFLRPDGRPIAPIVRPGAHEAAAGAVAPPMTTSGSSLFASTGKRQRGGDDGTGSELASYAKRRKQP